MNRLLTFHEKDVVGNTRIGPTFYIDADSEPVAVRIHAEHVTSDGELKVDIFDDGVSIFANHAASYEQSGSTKGPTIKYDTADTTVSLATGENTEDMAEDFTGDTIEEGSWVHCEVTDLKGGRNVSIHLELQPILDED